MHFLKTSYPDGPLCHTYVTSIAIEVTSIAMKARDQSY